MGALDRIRRRLARLPLGERPGRGVGPGRPTDREVMAALASALDHDEVLQWSGWVYAGRGIPPDEGLAESAAAVTDRRLVWMAASPGADADHELLAELLPLRLDRRTKRLLLRTHDRPESHPDLAVMWSFSVKDLTTALATRIPHDAGREPEP